MTFCENASRTAWQNPDGSYWEGYWLDREFIFENQIRNLHSYTRTHPGWVLADDGFCRWQGTPPPRFWESQPAAAATVATPAAPMQQAAIAPGGDVGGGALLLVLGLLGSAAYAFWQIKKGGDDFSDDYHPMSDVPALPVVYTDEHLDHVYQRYQQPTSQGISEPSPWQSTQVFPRSQRHPITAESPVITRDSPVIITDSITGDNQGGDDLAALKAGFEAVILPAPRNGYFLGEESFNPNSKAYTIVWDALTLGYSKNWLCQHVFKIAKGGTGSRYQILSELVNRVKQELGQ